MSGEHKGHVTAEALAAVSGAAAATVTPGMVERLSVLAERTATAVDVLSSPEMLELLEQVRKSAPTLTRVLQRLQQFADSGAMDTVMDLADVAHAARAAMTDGQISRLADGIRVLFELMDVLMASGIHDRAPALLNATIAARDEAATNKKSIGLLDLLRAPKEPELQFVLKFLLALGRRLPAVMQSNKQ